LPAAPLRRPAQRRDRPPHAHPRAHRAALHRRGHRLLPQPAGPARAEGGSRMKRTGNRDAGHEALLREAVSWFVRVHDEQASAADFNAWQEWMMRDARHQQAFQSVEDFWQASGSVKQPAWPLIEELGADTYDGAIPVAQWQAAAEQTSGRQTGTYFRPRFLAAAATLLAAVGAAWFFMTPRA